MASSPISILEFVQTCAQAFIAESGEQLIDSLLEHDEAYGEALREAIRDTPPEDLEADELLPHVHAIPERCRAAFASFMAACLVCMAGEEGDEEMDEGEISFAEHGRLAHAYSTLSDLYASETPVLTAFLNPLFVVMANRLMKASARASALSIAPPREPNSPRSIQDRTRLVLERSMQLTSAMWDQDMARTAEADGDSVAGDCIWPLANMLWRIYAERNLHNQANELRRTFNSLKPSETERLEQRKEVIRAHDVAESWYWRGRLSCVLLDFRTADEELQQAYEASMEEAETMAQRRAILSLQIPVKLLLGRLTSRAVLDAYDLQIYIPLLHAFRTGNLSRWRQLLEVPRTRDWLRRRNVWVMLYERGEILVWRNLFRRAAQLFQRNHPSAPKNRIPTSIFLAAATMALADNPDPDVGSDGQGDGQGEVEVELEDVIGILSSLIDQGLIRGYLAFSQLTLVLKVEAGKELAAFERLSDVEARQVLANA